MARFFANKVRQASDVEELVGETFSRCAQSLGACRDATHFVAYLYGIARNVLREYIRAQQRLSSQLRTTTTAGLGCIADLGASPVTLLAARKQNRQLLHALRALPLDYQIVMELKYFEGMTRDQIADIVGCPAGTVASRLRRGHEQLEQKMQRIVRDPGRLKTTLTELEDWADSIARGVGARSG